MYDSLSEKKLNFVLRRVRYASVSRNESSNEFSGQCRVIFESPVTGSDVHRVSSKYLGTLRHVGKSIYHTSHSFRTIHGSNSPFAHETIGITGDRSRDVANLEAVRPCFTVCRRSVSLSCTDNVATSSVHCSTSLNRLRPALFKRKLLL